MTNEEIIDRYLGTLYEKANVKGMIAASIKASTKGSVRPSVDGLLADPTVPIWTKNWIREEIRRRS